MERNPFIGPRPFREEDGSIFTGRTRELRDVASLVIANRVVVLHARSGVGKTSFLSGALIPRMRREGMDVFHARVPMLLETLRSTPTSSRASFDHNGTLLVIDQSEELFFARPDAGDVREWRETLLRQLVAALQDDPLLRVLIVIRDDFVTALETYAHLLPRRLDTRFRLAPLDVRHAVQMLRAGARIGGREFALGVAEKIAESVRTSLSSDRLEFEEFVDAVELQIVARAIWESLPPDCTVITHELAAATRHGAAAIGEYVDAALRRIVAQERLDERDLRVWIDSALLTPAGTRRTLTGDELPVAMRRVIEEMARLYLVRIEVRTGYSVYELAHDRLAVVIRETNARFFETMGRSVPPRESSAPRRARLWRWFR